jgi:hypothetical protein
MTIIATDMIVIFLLGGSVDEDDEFGMEEGRFCCFANSLPVIYLRMWLNEKPHMTSFVSCRYLMSVNWTLRRITTRKGKLLLQYQQSNS